jgi:hypothetical protein
MKRKDSKQQNKQKKSTSKESYRSLILVGVIIIGAIIGVLFWKNSNTSQRVNKSTNTSLTENSSVAADKELLVGRWTRTDSDGAYIIEIRSASAEGKLDARYFNPNPINVGSAAWQKSANGLVVVIELQDVNYPGSTYTLNFFPSENRMTGNYYQAVQGQNFDVDFVRAR